MSYVFMYAAPRRREGFEALASEILENLHILFRVNATLTHNVIDIVIACKG